MQTRTKRSRHPSPARIALALVAVLLASMSVLGSTRIVHAMPFGPKTDFATGTAPTSVAIGDVNGDGMPDLAVANHGGGVNTVSIRLGTGTGSFGAKTDFTTSTSPFFVAIGDVNEDGKPDLAVANEGADTVSILLGTGSGSFGAKTDFGTGDGPRSVAIADFNADGKPDLAVANAFTNTVSILLGTGTGSFGAKADFTAGTNAESVAIGDFNRDGAPDLAVANFNSNNVSILLGAGTGSFGAKTDFATGANPFSVAVGDVNGDGKPDLAVANDGASTVSILLGTGTGTFGAETPYATDGIPQSVAIGDFNEDGKSDLVIASNGANTVSILLGTGTGSFGATTGFATGVQPTSVAIGDFSRDGKPDLAATNESDNTVSILLGTGFGSTGTFLPKTDYATGTFAASEAIGDLDRDGNPDLAVANNTDNTVSILLGTGTGSFGTKTDFATGSHPWRMAVGDLNGDGKPDLAVANNSDNTVSILLGTGTGSFGAKTDFATGVAPFGVAIGDFNGDGKPDLAVTDSSANSVSVLLGTGTGSFGAKTDFATGGNPLSVAVGDFDGDGKLDLAVANDSADTVSILLGAGTGSFGAKTDFATGAQPYSVTIGDVNGDGRPDLAIANVLLASGSVSILLGTGTGSFGAKTDFAAGASPSSVAIGDLDGDGKPDLAVANYVAGTVSILRGTGTGSFGAKTDFAAGASPYTVIISDLNRDGKPDLAVANGLTNTVSVLLQPSLFVVNSSNDANDGTCDTAHCSLREAITAANAQAGADVIHFSIGSGAVTIAPGSALPAITSPVTIDGTTQPGFAGAPIVELNGTGAGGATHGITLAAGSIDSTIRGLVINRFGGNGIDVLSGATGSSVIVGNYIGTNVAGTAALANANGIVVESGAANTTIGGTVPGARNLISGHTPGVGVGIYVDPGAGTGTQIIGNYIGTNAAGTAAIANFFGVDVRTTVTVGGTTPGSGNVISGNSFGIHAAVGGAPTIQGNFVGTSASGLAALPNDTGVLLNSPGGFTLGGSTAAARNVISGNTNFGVGIQFGDGNTVQGNWIGLDAFGTGVLGNTVAGIHIQASQNNVIGSVAAGEGNSIANTNGNGVKIDATAGASNGNTIRGNSVYANSGAGIALTAGGNASLAAPVITLVAATVTGTACNSCTIDVYSDTAAQGQIYEGSTTANGSGAWTFTGGIAGPNVTATATDGTGNTSSFSAPVPVYLLRVAGNPGNPGFGGDGGAANLPAVRVNDPHGLFETTTKVLYFADTNNNRIRTITPNLPTGIINTIAGGGSAGFSGDNGAPLSALLNLPRDVTVAANGDYFIADTGNCRIRKVSGGTITTIAGTATCGYNGDGMAATTAQLSQPRGVAVDALGNVFIADTENNRIRRVDAGTGNISTIVGTGAVGSGGDGGSATVATLRLPYDIVISPLPSGIGSYIVADTGNNIIRSINIGSGMISTIAGTAVTPYNGDGIPAVSANLDDPEAVAVDGEGDVYIADTNHNRVRQVNHTTGIILTALGSGQGGNPDGAVVNPYLAHLEHPQGVATGSVDVATPTYISTVQTNNDPSTGGPDTSHPGSGNFCTQKFATPLAGIADWSVIMMTVGLIGARRRVRWLFQLLSGRLRLRPRMAAV